MDAYEGMARANYQLGHKHEAESAFEAALTESIYTPSVLKDWGDMLQDLGEDFQKAESMYKRAIAEDTQATFDFAHGALGMFYYRLGRPTEAVKEFEMARSISYYPARIETDWGDALMEIGQLDDARTHYNAAKDLDPQMCDAWLGLGRLDYRSAVDGGNANDKEGDFEKPLQKALNACPYPGRVWAVWADTIYAGPVAGDFTSPYLRLSQWDPGHLLARMRLTRSAPEPRRGFEIRQAVRDVHSKLYFLRQLGADSISEKRYDDAAVFLSQARSEAPEDTFSHNAEVAVSVATGKIDRAKLRTLLPSLLDGSVDWPLIDVLLKLKWFQEAETLARNAFRLAPWDAFVNHEYAFALAGSGKIDESRVHFRRAAGGFFRMGGSTDEAREVFEALLSPQHAGHLDPDFRQACQQELDRINKFRPPQ